MRRGRIDPSIVLSLVNVGFYAFLLSILVISGAFLFAITHGWALDNPAWKVQRIQAEKYGDVQRLRVLDYVSSAGTRVCPPEWKCTGGVDHVSCCGQADAYEADDFRLAEDGTYIAILTCNDPDDCEAVPGKIERKPGTEFVVPADKLLVNYDPVNNTGHGWIWISPTQPEFGLPVVYCYAPPAGL